MDGSLASKMLSPRARTPHVEGGGTTTQDPGMGSRSTSQSFDLTALASLS